jgi:pilus assembly protein CpaB
MSRRGVGIGVALVLALVGTVALVAWVGKAEERALAGEELVQVYVVAAPVPIGTAAEELEQLVTVEQVPTKVRAVGAVASLTSLTGRVAAVDLVPGEQLVDSRFVERTEFADRQVGIDVPDDMVEITVRLAPERAVGGLVEPGQTVAILASFDALESPTGSVREDPNGDLYVVPVQATSPVGGTNSGSTDVLLRKTLVTAVQESRRASSAGGGGEDETNRLTTSPEDELLITMAVPPGDAERIVFTAEFGHLWLAVERETVPEDDDPARTISNVFTDGSASR